MGLMYLCAYSYPAIICIFVKLYLVWQFKRLLFTRDHGMFTFVVLSHINVAFVDVLVFSGTTLNEQYQLFIVRYFSFSYCIMGAAGFYFILKQCKLEHATLPFVLTNVVLLIFGILMLIGDSMIAGVTTSGCFLEPILGTGHDILMFFGVFICFWLMTTLRKPKIKSDRLQKVTIGYFFFSTIPMLISLLIMVISQLNGQYGNPATYFPFSTLVLLLVCCITYYRVSLPKLQFYIPFTKGFRLLRTFYRLTLTHADGKLELDNLLKEARDILVSDYANDSQSKAQTAKSLNIRPNTFYKQRNKNTK